MLDEYLVLILDKLVLIGFLETRASLSVDIIISFLALLPLLSGLSILFAIRNYLKLHEVTQLLLFILTVMILVLFAYIVHYKEGLSVLLQQSSIDVSVALFGVIIHIVISIVTMSLWLFVLLYALSDKKRRALPGLYSESHSKAGKRVFKGIVLMALSSVSIYWILYIA